MIDILFICLCYLIDYLYVFVINSKMVKWLVFFYLYMFLCIKIFEGDFF